MNEVLLILKWCLQFYMIVRPIRRAIDRDMVEDRQQRPQWELRAEEFRRNVGAFEDDRADEQAITEALQRDDLNLADELNEFDDDDDADF